MDNFEKPQTTLVPDKKDSQANLPPKTADISSGSGIEQLRSDLKEKLPLERVLEMAKKNGIDLEFAEKRYDEIINFYSSVENLRDSLKEKDKEHFENKWILDHLASIPVHIKDFIKNPDLIYSTGRGSYQYGEPFSYFTDWQFYGELDEVFKLKPQIIVATPKSGILPSIIVKECVKQYIKVAGEKWEPYFYIPSNKSYKFVDQTSHYGPFLGISQVHEIINSGNLDKQKEYLLKLYTEKKTGEHPNLIPIFQELSRIESVILKEMPESSESRVTIFDEFISKGRNTDGISFFFNVAFEMLKRNGLIGAGSKLDINIISFRNERLSNNAPGRGFISDSNFGKGGGSKAEHWLTRRLFKLIGNSIANDYWLVKSYKSKLEKTD